MFNLAKTLILAMLLLALSACDVFVEDTPDAVVVEDRTPDVVIEDTTPDPPQDVDITIDNSGDSGDSDKAPPAEPAPGG